MENYEMKNRYKTRWIILAALALVVLTHGMIHLMYVTGIGDKAGDWLGYGGDSYLADLLGVDMQPLITTLVTIVVLFSLISALGLIRIPFLRKYAWKAMIVANVASLLCFLVMLGGMAPNDLAHVYGMITSAVLLSFGFWGQNLETSVAANLPVYLRKMIFKVVA